MSCSFLVEQVLAEQAGAEREQRGERARERLALAENDDNRTLARSLAGMRVSFDGCRTSLIDGRGPTSAARRRGRSEEDGDNFPSSLACDSTRVRSRYYRLADFRAAQLHFLAVCDTLSRSDGELHQDPDLSQSCKCAVE